MSKLLEFISYHDLTNWSVAHLLENQFNYNQEYPLVKIGDFLKRNKTQIIVKDDVEYKRVTIKLNNGGIYLRDRKIGKEIGTKKQYLIKQGQFLLSKIDARNGAFGLATDEVDGAIITADFFAYDIDASKIEPYFLVLTTTTKQFKKFAQSASSGTTGRQRINEQRFLDVKIPLPPLEKQKEIVEAYQSKIALAEKQEQEAKEKEKEIEEYLYRELGIEITKKEDKANKLLNFIEYKNLIDWNMHKKDDALHSNKFPEYKLSDLSPISSGGTPRRNNLEYYRNGTIPWVKTGEVRDNIIMDTEEKITNKALKNSSAKIYPVNSIIIAMYGATAGRTAKLGIEASTNQACAVLYNINTNIIDIDFLWYYLMTQINNFKNLAEGSAQPNLNSMKIKNFKIPVPPLNIQKRIKTTIECLKHEIKELKKQALQNRTLALQDFEREIFNEA